MKITCTAFVLLIQTLKCLASDDSPFQLTNKDTGFCLVKSNNQCSDLRWTSSDRLLVQEKHKCLGVQGQSVGSDLSLYDCDEKSDFQKWECKNGTLLALKGQELYVQLTADNTAVLSKTVGPNNHLIITGTTKGACTRTYRELFSIGGNAAGQLCMFPFLYKDQWYSDCTKADSTLLWCAVETKYQSERWGLCPVTSKEGWTINPTTGAYYQLNSQSALTWPQADASCKQQGASLLSITDPHQHAYVTALLGAGGNKLWTGMILDPEHGWIWANGDPYCYMKWDSGHPLPNPGQNCAIIDPAVQFSWQSSSCSKKLGYICYSKATEVVPTQATEPGFCSSPWIPYNGHCFNLNRTDSTWSDAQKECRRGGGDLVTIRNVEDQSFLITQIGYISTDELWIGLNDRKTERLFEWTDHSTVTFTSWEFGKPVVSTDLKDCVVMKGEKGNWADHGCGEKHGYICMKMSASESTGDEVKKEEGCKNGWTRHASYCYYIGLQTKTFDEAKDDCTSSSSYLADVSSGVDNAFLVSLVGMRPEKCFWLGLSNQKNLDQFVWTNTDSVRFTHWNAEMPGYEQGCVAMRTGISAGLWDLLPCTNKEKYICKHLAEGEVVTAPPPTQAAPKCEDGWNRVGTRNSCAKFFTGPRSGEKTWFEARDYCRAIGGDLLSIHSNTELFVARHGRAWIGLQSPDPTTGYVWSDGSAVNFLHWQDGEPNNHNNEESCAEFRMYYADEAGSWNDVNCESYNDWICQIRGGVTPKPPPNNTVTDFNTTSDGWLMWRGNQYFINRNSVSMEDARHFCQQRHGDLVSISSKDENVFIWKQISRSYGSYYLGLSVDLDGSFWWMDGSSGGFQQWDQEQPNSNVFDENCVTMTYYMGFWRTCNCGQEHQFICKRGNSAPVNTTAAPTVPPKGGCPLKWTKFDSKCYSVISNRVATWEDARRQCITMGGNLVSIPTRRVQAFLTTKMAETTTTDLWIGLNCLKQDGFYWTDGKKRQYTNWGYSKYRRRQGSFYQRWNEEECVVMNGNPSLGTGKWFSKSCNDTSGFVCLRNLDPSTPPQPEPAVTNIYVTLGNDSIKVVNQNLTWDDAKKHCEGDKANLASLRNEWTQAYVELLAMNLKTPLWIGLNKEQTGGYFRYIDGWHLNSASWAEGEPSRNKPCVYLDMDGKWKTTFCNRTMSGVCMQSTDVPPTESTNFPGVCPEETNEEYRQSYTWLPYKGHCYLFITDEIEWADAASSCVRHGGVLASIEDPSEQQFIKTNVEIFQDSHSAFWIGLFKTHKGSWLWLDKTVMDYTNWAADEPDNDYGEIGTIDGAWRTGRRWHDRAYICKTPKVAAVDPGSKPEPHGSTDPRSRVHTTLIVVLVIAITSTLIAFAFFVYKKSPRPNLPTFDNPLYFDSERSQPDVVDTNKLIENAEAVVNPEPIITL